MREPGLELLFEATGDLSPAVTIGSTPNGLERVIPIPAGGPFEGPHIRGKMVGGYDWQLTRPDGVTVIDALYLLETDDGVHLRCRNRGLRHGDPAVMQRLAAGEDVDADEYYFRCVPEFSAPAGRYGWLNDNIFVSTGARFSQAIKVRFYRLT